MLSIVPMQAVPNHTFSAVIPLGADENIELQFTMQYNEVGEFWFVDISRDNEMLLSAYPWIPAQDLLEQFQYLRIGHAYIVPYSQVTKQLPDAETLSTEWAVLWGDDELGDDDL